MFSQFIGFPSILTEVSSSKSAQIPYAVCPTNIVLQNPKQIPKENDYLLNWIDQGFWAVLQSNNKRITT